MLFRGACCAMVTPFTRENTVDHAVLGRLARYQIERGTNALLVCGTTGEAATMSLRERAEAVETVADAAQGRVPILAGVGGNDTSRAISVCRLMKRAGADAALSVTPYYNKTSQAGLLAHYAAIADASPMPVLLYDVPARTGMRIEMPTLEALAKHPNIAGLKATEITQTDCLPVYAGSDALILPMRALGAIGAICVASNLFPEMLRSLLEDDIESARALHFRLLPLFRALSAQVNPIPIKAAMSMLGQCAEAMRPPLVPLHDDERNDLEQIVRLLCSA